MTAHVCSVRRIVEVWRHAAIADPDADAKERP